MKLNLAYFLFNPVAAHFQSYRRLLQMTTINASANTVIFHLHSVLMKSSSLFFRDPGNKLEMFEDTRFVPPE